MIKVGLATPQRLAVIAATVTGVLTGAAIVGTRVVVDALGPATIGMARYAIALLLLLPIVIATGASLAVQRRDRFAVVALGVLQFGVQIVLINVGLQSVASAAGPVSERLVGAAVRRCVERAGIRHLALGLGAHGRVARDDVRCIHTAHRPGPGDAAAR